MMSFDRIKNFYSYYHTYGEVSRRNPSQWFVITSWCGRRDFLNAFFHATQQLVYEIAVTIFYSIAWAGTLGYYRDFKTSAWLHLNQGTIYAGTLPISCLGCLFPAIVNEYVLRLTYHLSVRPVNENHPVNELIQRMIPSDRDWQSLKFKLSIEIH